MISVQIFNVKPGEFVHLKDDVYSPLWIRSTFDRSSKKYSLISYDDANHELFCKANRVVYVENLDSLK